MNDTIKTILERKTIRAYTDEPISQADLDLILECGMRAPSALNRQPWHFTVVKSRAMLDKISARNKAIMINSPEERVRIMAADPNFDSFRSGPMAVIVSSENMKENSIADCANAMQNMALASKSLGLGSCYIASFRVCLLEPEGEDLKNELGIPDGYTPLFALAIGHAAEDPEQKPRNENVFNYID